MQESNRGASKRPEQILKELSKEQTENGDKGGKSHPYHGLKPVREKAKEESPNLLNGVKKAKVRHEAHAPFVQNRGQ